MTTILVTGAAGWIGRVVCRALQDRGCFVLGADMQEREGPWDAFLPLDITQDEFPEAVSLDALCDGRKAIAVVHCAGLAHYPVETEAVKQQMFAVNAEGTRKLIRACGSWGIDRFVYVSSIAFYDWGDAEGNTVTEDSPVSARTAYAASKLEGEQAVLDSNLKGRVIRLATVFGKGDQANFARLARALKSGRFLIPGRGEATKSLISVNIAAECLAELALQDEVPYALMNLGLTSPPSLQMICETFSRKCGFPPARRLPLPVFRLLTAMGDGLACIKPGFPLTSETLWKLTTSTAVDCSRAASLLRGMVKTTFAVELERCADYYREL